MCLTSAWPTVRGRVTTAVNVTSIGAYETSMSSANWNVPEVANKPTTFTLVVGNQNFSVTGADNSAQSVADAINASYGNLVQATTVNISPTDTRISLKSAALGQTNLDILNIPTTAAPTSLQTQARRWLCRQPDERVLGRDGQSRPPTTSSWAAIN